MKRVFRQWLAGLLSVVLVFTLLPAAALAEEADGPAEQTAVEQVQALINALPDADTITAENRADVQAQIDAIGAAMAELTEDQTATLDTARYDAAVTALLALDAPSALEQVQALIGALPDADAITTENQADVQAQIDAIDAAMAELTEDQAAALDTTRYDAAAAALLALDAPSALEQVQALIDALPDAESITADNRADVEAQLTAIDEAKQDLTDDELDTLDITRYLAAVEAILALDDMAGANEPETIATGVPYIEANGDSQTQGSATDITNGTTEWNDGWYVVSGDVTISSRIKVNGNVNLILEDSYTLTAQQGISVNVGNSLTIYCQSGHAGTLVATNPTSGGGGGAAIGADRAAGAGSITINGGNITATVTTAGGACIGMGGWNGAAGSVTVNNGYLKLTGNAGDEGPFGAAGTVAINGGIVEYSGRTNGTNSLNYAQKQNCIVFNGDSGQVYGDLTITGDVTIPYGKTLTVPSGSTLTVAEGATLTNEGSISNGGNIVILAPGTLSNRGTIKDYGEIIGNVTGTQPETVEANYLDWDPDSKSLVEKTVPQKDLVPVKNDTTTWTNDWYVVSESVTVSERITVSGTVHLILMDGCTLTAQKGITVAGSNSLTIYGQSGQSGTLSATGSGGAGIGGDTTQGFGTITINGGTVNATGSGNGAGIGGGDHGSGGTIIINGGTVNATGSGNGAGIGGGDHGSGGTIIINGGNIIANGGHYGAGIGTGYYYNSETYCSITINGGNIIATGGGAGAGIGTGYLCEINCSITINGGNITATGGYAGGGGGAGVGAGYLGYTGTITINGGDVIASSDRYESGVGIGCTSTQEPATITITGGIVTATGRRAGIGGGNKTSKDTITISGGIITATGGFSGIGPIKDVSVGVFSTGTDGNAVIHANSIYDKSKQDSWSGVIFEGDSGKVYGNPTPVENFEVTGSETLTIPNGTSLTVAKGVTLTNNGKIYVGSQDGMSAALTNEGTIINKNLIDVWGQLTNGEIGIQNSGSIVYHFNLDVKAPTFADAEYGYSQPSAQEITITNNGELKATITEVKLEGNDFDLNVGAKTELSTGNSDKSWTIRPKPDLPVGEHTATITVIYKSDSGTSRTSTAKVTFTVTKANPTVTVSASGDPTYGSDITLTAEVTTATGVASSEINGEVTFKAGNVELGKARAENGTATLVIKGTDTDKQKDIFNNNEITAEYAGNDSIEKGTGTGTVTVKQKPLTFDFNATDRTYDTTTKVEGSFDVKGKVDGDNVSVSDYTANVEDKDVGNAKDVTAKVTELGGDDARYYTPGAVDGGTVDITQATLDLTVADVSITYGDKLTDDLLDGSTTKIQGTETTITGTFAWEEQNAVPTVSDSGTTKYKVVFTPSPEAPENFTEASRSTEITITVGKATPTVTVQAVTGTYGDNITITAQVDADGVDASLVTGEVTFKADGTELGTGIKGADNKWTLTVSGSERDKQHALFGSNGSSNVTATYSGDGNFTEGSDSGNASMEKRALTYDVTATDRVYDGKTDVTVSLSPTNLVGTDSVTLTATGNLSSPNAATYNQVDLTEVSINDGGDAKYYSVESTASNKDLTTDVTISKATVKFDVSGNSLSYTGSDQKATVTKTAPVGLELAEATDYEVYYTAQNAENTTGGTKDGKTDAGTYDVWVKLTDDTHNNYMFEGDKQEAKVGELTISKVMAECTAPTPKEDLTYTGAAQALVEAGTTDDGTMMYAVTQVESPEPDNDQFSKTIPTGTNAGTYYVWYYVVGDKSHTDSAKAYVTVIIKKAEVTFTVSDNSHAYDGTAKKVTLTNSNTSSAPELMETSGYTVSYGSDKVSSKTDVGEYDIYIKLTEAAAKNYKFEGKGDSETELTVTGEKLRITQATSTVSDVTITGADGKLTYGDTFTVSAKIDAPDTMTGTVTFEAGDVELGMATSHDGGVWTITVGANEQVKQHAIFGSGENTKITAKYSGDKNIEASSGSKDDVTVAQKPLTYSVTATGRVWDGTTGVTVALTATNTVTGDVVTLTAKGDLDNEGKAGTYNTVNLSEVKIDGTDGKYYATDSTKAGMTLDSEIEITKHNSSVTAPAGKPDLTYSGAGQELVNPGSTSDGTMMYALGENDNNAPTDGFSSAIPTGTDAKTYYVWYYVQGDENHDDSGKACVEVNIAKAEVTFEVSGNNYTYDGEAEKVTLANNNTSSAPELVETSGYTVTYGDDKAPSKTDVGEYDIHIKLTEEAAKNYKFAGKDDGVTELTVADKKLSITKATSTVSDLTITGEGEGLTYGDTFTISAKVNAPGTVTGTVTFSAGDVELGKAESGVGGVWTITVGADERAKQHAIFDNKTISAEYSGDKNINESSGTNTTVTVAQKPLTYTVTAEGRDWNGETGVDVTLVATNTVTGDVVTLTAKGDLANEGEGGTYKKVNLSDVKINGKDKGYYTTETERTDVDLTAEIQITKHDSNVTAPVGKSDLTYTGEPLELIDAATGVEGGTVKYYVGDTAPEDGTDEWQTEVSAITGLNAGEYTVWYYVDGDENHNDTEPQSVTVTIGKAEGEGSVIMKDYLCMQTDINPEPESDTNGTANVKYTYAKRGQENYSDTKPTTAGEYTVRAEFEETENYKSFTATADFTINHHFNEGWEADGDGYQHTCPCDTGVRLQETGLEKVPDSLKNNEALDTVEEIKQVLVEEVKKGASIPDNNTAVYDVRLQVQSGGSGWVDVAEENFPEDGITVILPYPEGTNSSYTFTVIHMITTGENAGDMENLEPTNGEDGISFTVKSLSPICVGWTAPPSSSGYYPSYYNVTVPSDFEGGSVTSDRASAQQGNKVTLTVKPDEGYHFGSLTVNDRNGKPVELTDNGDGTYSFTMPYGQVTVAAEFVKCGSLDFTDLDTKAWYHDYTDYVIAHGLMQGTGNNIFAPAGTVNRAQMVMVLWNMSGKPVVNYYMTYSDVSEDAWYSEAVRWATSEGIVGGYGNGKFGPNDSITREQMAVMLYRYEQKYGDGGFTGDWMYRLPFTDLDQISDWAFEAVAWCNMEGVITGKDNNVFDPKGFAKRSEMAAILTRYLTQDKKYLSSSR